MSQERDTESAFLLFAARGERCGDAPHRHKNVKVPAKPEQRVDKIHGVVVGQPVTLHVEVEVFRCGVGAFHAFRRGQDCGISGRRWRP